jgi:hypothetical protein
VLGPTDTAEKQADSLVANELVHDPVIPENGRRRDPIKAIKERAIVHGTHTLTDACRTTDVGEDETDRDLGAIDTDLVQALYAAAADGRITREACEPDVTQNGAAGALERRGAQLAVGRAGQTPKNAPRAS